MDDKDERKPRADAERNRERLLATAKATFAKKGIDASLEEIARQAGVGIGTLYRHFPTRDALVASVYRNEAHQLAAAARALSATHTPIEAMRAWLNLFIDYMMTKRGLLSALDSLVGGTSALYADNTEQMTSTMRMLAERAVESGEVKLKVDPVVLLRALAGVGKSAAEDDWVIGARQLVDIFIAGIRASTPNGPSNKGRTGNRRRTPSSDGLARKRPRVRSGK